MLDVAVRYQNTHRHKRLYRNFLSRRTAFQVFTSGIGKPFPHTVRVVLPKALILRPASQSFSWLVSLRFFSWSLYLLSTRCGLSVCSGLNQCLLSLRRYFEGLGSIALLIEAGVPLPQLLHTLTRRSFEGFRSALSLLEPTTLGWTRVMCTCSMPLQSRFACFLVCRGHLQGVFLYVPEGLFAALYWPMNLSVLSFLPLLPIPSCWVFPSFLLKAPMQFLACASFQLLVDVALVALFFVLGDRKGVHPPPALQSPPPTPAQSRAEKGEVPTGATSYRASSLPSRAPSPATAVPPASK